MHMHPTFIVKLYAKLCINHSLFEANDAQTSPVEPNHLSKLPPYKAHNIPLVTNLRILMNTMSSEPEYLSTGLEYYDETKDSPLMKKVFENLSPENGLILRNELDELYERLTESKANEEELRRR